MTTVIGVTGTRLGMTTAQKDTWRGLVPDGGFTLHHGGCTGADTDAVEIAVSVCPSAKIVAWPGPSGASAISLFYSTKSHSPRPFRVRNQRVVDRVGTLYAFPDRKPMRVRSGTSMTVNLAKRREISIVIIWPDGTTKTERARQRFISFR
jgi:hypothetical protein